ncbi:MAG: hypothetical protein KC983_12215, partial [Phycisphaerales bacterium]|nr:hypothetical protein [Phycisphaerales bacterium]
MGYGIQSTRGIVLRAGAACLCMGALAASLLTITASDAFAVSDASAAEAVARGERLALTQEIVKRSFRLDDVEIAALAIVGDPADAMTVNIAVDGVGYTLALHTHSVRSDFYEVRVQHADGTWTNAVPSPVTSLRGQVLGMPETAIAGALLEDGLHAMIRMGSDPANAERIWIEPISRIVPDSEGLYAIYRGSDVQPIPNGCGMSDAANAEGFAEALAGMDKDAIRTGAQLGGGGGGVCVAELACDADTEYFNTYGSVAATEAQINSVINAVNMQYESQVALTHQITTILVRTGSDPYTSTDPETRLCQFITEWTNNQTGVQRDVAHLFTGAQINGSVIGIAADIGQTGICVSQGSCTGGQFGTQGSYCLSQSDFDSNFACKTDLSAHELGHLCGP